VALGYPAIRMSMEKKKLDDAAKEILATLQRAKFQAVRTKTIHCVVFNLTQNTYNLEIYNYNNNQWEIILQRTIPSPLNFSSANLPDPDSLGAIDFNNQIIFNSLGFADRQGTITLQHPNLTHYTGVEDLRIIRIMIGGSIDIVKEES
jgi:Tfp pilus assembly protein FimT